MIRIPCPGRDSDHFVKMFVPRSTVLITPGRGFWTGTPDGHVMHVNGDRDMSEETLNALRHLMDLAVKQFSTPGPSEGI